MTTIKRFDDVRNWAKIRGLKQADPQMQYQRFLQEATEIHKAMVLNDDKEIKDAIGDTIVTLINLAQSMGMNAEECLEVAFKEIECRKGLTRNGEFIRYKKLTGAERNICDELQGNRGNHYFKPNMLDIFKPENFKG